MTSNATKLCECGCGQPAPIAKETSTRYGYVKGQPKRFVSGHNAFRHPPIDESSIPPKLCECGCGGYTAIALENDASSGKVRGQRMRFMPHHHSQRTQREAFDVHAIPGKADECWEWHGKLNNKGYGTFTYKGKHRFAHRVSHEFFNGPIPKGLNVLHKCDNPKCWNPDHLFLGTQRDNVLDMVAKGRATRNPNHGANHHQTKILANDAILMRGLRSEGVGVKSISRLFGIGRDTTREVFREKRWEQDAFMPSYKGTGRA